MGRIEGRKGDSIMTTLRNTYHDTAARTRYTEEELDSIRNTHPANWTAAEQALVQRLRHKLCGIAGCTCGGTFGERA